MRVSLLAILQGVSFFRQLVAAPYTCQEPNFGKENGKELQVMMAYVKNYWALNRPFPCGQEF